MNIHFTDDNLFCDLIESTIFKIEVGSGMYNLKTPESDTDILCIYLEGSLNLTSTIQTHHQLQYKDINNNIDYIFTSLTQFVKNIMSGDSTINYEVLQTSEFKNKFYDVWFFLNNCSKYNVIKSYLGMAKRDLKYLKYYQSNKKAYHIVRGILLAEAIIENKDIFKVLEEQHNSLSIMRKESSLLDFEHIFKRNEIKMNELRDTIQESRITSTEISNINISILNVYNEYKEYQKNYIEYNFIIEEAVYNDKFNYN